MLAEAQVFSKTTYCCYLSDNKPVSRLYKESTISYKLPNTALQPHGGRTMGTACSAGNTHGGLHKQAFGIARQSEADPLLLLHHMPRLGAASCGTVRYAQT